MIGERMRWSVAAAAIAAAAMAMPVWPDEATGSGSELARAARQLEAAEAAERRAREQLSKLRASGRASAEEIADFEAFLERLRASVASHRQAVERFRSGDVLRAAPGDGRSHRRKPDAGGPILTEQERLRGLDRRLGASLGEFDEMLLREQEKVAARRSSASASGGAAGASAGAVEGGDGDEGDGAIADWEQASGEGRGEQRTAAVPAEQSTAGGAIGPLPPADSSESEAAADARLSKTPSAEERRGARGGSRMPPDIPDGRDDDVVARQLREAAENETDPVLREKLWDEYRKYKGVSR